MPPRRRPRWAVAFVLSAAAASTLACEASPHAGRLGVEATGPIRVVDASGRAWAFEAPPVRIVSLVPSATRTLQALGASETVVGRTDFDTAPWLEGVASVGGGIEPSMEALVSLRPDLVVRFAGEQDARTPARLDELGIPHLALRPDRIDDVYEAVRLLGAVTGRAGPADSLVAAIRAELAEVARSVEGLPRQRTAYLLGGTPPWVAGPDTFISEIMGIAGGDNVFDDLGTLYASVSPEELRSRPIDVVLVASAAGLDTAWTRGARVEVVGDALLFPDPDVGDAARLVASLLHPGRAP